MQPDFPDLTIEEIFNSDIKPDPAIVKIIFTNALNTQMFDESWDAIYNVFLVGFNLGYTIGAKSK